MSAGLYLTLMLGVIAILTAIVVPTLLWKKCDTCGARNGLDAKDCKQCKKAFRDS